MHFRLAANEPHEIAEILDFWVRKEENGSRPTNTAGAIRTLIEKDPETLILAVDNDEILGTIIAG
jgi:hypothetical protein